MIYFSHPIVDYDTKFESLVEKFIETTFEDSVENPNQTKHQKEYAVQGMEYFINLARSCDACVFVRMPNGKLGAGVAKEVESFMKDDKPVFEFDRFENIIKDVKVMPPKEEIMSIQETREEIRKYFKNQ